MKALSILQPWASLIVGGARSPGVKRTENRGRSVALAARPLIGALVAIHASKRRDLDAFEDMRNAVRGGAEHLRKAAARPHRDERERERDERHLDLPRPHRLVASHVRGGDWAPSAFASA